MTAMLHAKVAKVASSTRTQAHARAKTARPNLHQCSQ
jgi:hypothetical protein